jgi:ectoine hydroxylase-related dioxygenase (phytanoyl-CoA dioxygenase family)
MDFPTLRFDQESLRARVVPPSVAEAAAAAFRSAGCLLVEGVIDVALVDTLRDAFLTRYREYLVPRHHDDALEVGSRRYMVTVRVEAPFLDVEVYANPMLVPILTELLDAVRLFGFGCVVALPNSPEQHMHRDASGLFGEASLDETVPPYAISALIPLVDMEGRVGTTRVLLGSHLRFGDGDWTFGTAEPVVKRGSVLLMDYRLFHCGTPNTSDAPRPLLYNGYARPWFRDPVNYSRQGAVVMTRDDLESIPPEHRKLFAGATLV